MKYCNKCGVVLSKNNKYGVCNRCRDRTGGNNPFYGKHHTQETINKTKEKLSSISKSLWLTPEYREKVIKNAIGKKRSNKFKETQRIAALKQFKDKAQRISRSNTMKTSWKNGNIIKNKYSCNSSKLENNFFKELKEICPSAIQHPALRFSNGRWVKPDIFIEDLNLIIEFYGDYWHANPVKYKGEDLVNGKKVSMIWYNDEMRIAQIKAEHNLDVIIVWQSEYIKDKISLFKRLDALINYESCSQ